MNDSDLKILRKVVPDYVGRVSIDHEMIEYFEDDFEPMEEGILLEDITALELLVVIEAINVGFLKTA